ncbi:MAG: hypothetical protein DRO46_03360 [Candidatus Hecatellales archaeon]|nr:MAG: hypothetical protein DRO46_03360 [Candidatus Hecatellales archaeon]
MQSTRDGTFLLSLPKEWAKRFNLKKGSPIYVKERMDGCLILDPRYGIEETQEVTLKPSENLEDAILSSYLLGYGLITIEAERRLEEEDRERIRRAVSRLVGVEVIEEDVRRVTLQCLLQATAIPPEKILRRQYVLSRSLLEDAFRALLTADPEAAGKVRERDEEVDRLYFLLVRVLRSLILNPRLSEKLGISPIDCLDYRLAASLVERIADTSVELADLTHRFKVQGMVARRLSSLLKAVGESLSQAYEEALKALFSRNNKIFNSALKSMEAATLTLERLEAEASKYGRSPPTLYILLTLTRTLLEQIKDITDLAYPRPQPA